MRIVAPLGRPGGHREVTIDVATGPDTRHGHAVVFKGSGRPGRSPGPCSPPRISLKTYAAVAEGKARLVAVLRLSAMRRLRHATPIG